MVLRLSPEEFDLMRSALDAYRRSIREQANRLIASEAAIELCTRRLRVEALLADLPHSQSLASGAGRVVPMPAPKEQSSESWPERVA